MFLNICRGTITILVILFSPLFVYACTLWGASGNYTIHGGTLIIKNRDWRPDHRQVLRLIKPKEGLRYFGLFAEDGSNPGLKAGLNEKGLVIISAAVDSLPLPIKKTVRQKRGIMAHLLRECTSVDEALMHKDYFSGAVFYLLADSGKIASLEIGPEGHYAVNTTVNGVIYHTNHYLQKEMIPFNYRIPPGSHRRLERIAQLLKETPPPYSLQDFLKFSMDQHDGPDQSIFRRGSKPNKPRTLSTWAVEIPPKGDPYLYVRILNPGEEERVFRKTASEIFSDRYLPTTGTNQ